MQETADGMDNTSAAEQVLRGIPALFTTTSMVDLTAEIGVLAGGIAPLEGCVLLCFSVAPAAMQPFAWPESWQESAALFTHVAAEALWRACETEGYAADEAVSSHLPAGLPGGGWLAFPVRHEGNPYGLVLFAQRADAGPWTGKQRSLLSNLIRHVAAALAYRHSLAETGLHRLVLDSMMDSMSASVYVTDPETDRILFMNRSMKESFGLHDPEGQICWQVLQKGMDGRCPFCPLDTLMTGGLHTPPAKWEETNTVTGRVYENHDCLIRWLDGSIVHMQQSVDITNSKELASAAISDELTGLLGRRAGEAALMQSLETARREGAPVTVCLYDIDLLREINDSYGHAEGDKVIVRMAHLLRDHIRPGDILFRLSGDQFLSAFYNTDRKSAAVIVQHMQQVFATDGSLPHAVSFCYGLLQIEPGETVDFSAILLQADERMYEQKRRYHIQRRDQDRRQQDDQQHANAASFSFPQEYLYDALVRSTDDYLFVGNLKTNTFRYPPDMVEEFNLPGEVIHNAAAVWSDKIHENDREAFLESNMEVADGRVDNHNIEYRAKNHKGEWVWLRCRGHLERDETGEPCLFAGLITNLGRKNKIDHMTGLFNKYAFEEDVKHLLDSPATTCVGMMILDIDDFKHVNDLHDREFGDEVLRMVAQKIQGLLPGNAAIYRLDGDEFGILVSNGSRIDLQDAYTAIHAAFRHQQTCEGQTYFCSFSAGAVLSPDHADNYLNLMKYASYSLEHAKSSGKNRLTFYSHDIRRHKARALELTELLRESVDNGFADFHLCYQPQVDASTGEVVGAEALARWRCDKYGAISPVEFIPLLEQSGLIIPVGKWIFRQAAERCRQWVAARADFVMSVNLSYLQVTEPDFLTFMDDTLREIGLQPANLVVELTESYLVKGIETVRGIFEGIRGLGVRIAMDDFGTGYSSLEVLKQAPADIVKIDKAFIRDIRTSHFDATFIRFIVALCHDVGIKVCLEGVETPEEYQIVAPMDLDYIQGFLFGRPEPEATFPVHYLRPGTSLLQ